VAASGGPFVAVNCGAVPPTLMEDNFFGHVRCAFTDARAERAGLLEQAAGGTLFLDEVGDLPLESQASLLRVLQDRTFTRIGGQRQLEADFRLIGATNADLEEAVAARRFREDLYWRFDVITIRVPPLRRVLRAFGGCFDSSLAAEGSRLAHHDNEEARRRAAALQRRGIQRRDAGLCRRCCRRR